MSNPLSASTGNLSDAPSRMAIYKLKSREKHSGFLDRDPKVNFYKYSIALEAEYLIGNDKLDRGIGLKFVKDVSSVPFQFLMFHNQQLQIAVDMFKNCNTILHIDATGSLMARIKGSGDRRPLTYSMVPTLPDDVRYTGDKFPICEFASTAHNVPDITHPMKKFMYYKDQLSKTAHPIIIVTDWSWALLYAASQAFNGMQLSDYANFCYRLVHGKLNTKRVSL